MKKITLCMLLVFTISLQAQNKLLSSIDESYNGSSWDNNSGSNYEYDSNNNLISETYYNWNTEGEWEISYKDSYAYNANNKAIEYIFQEWNSVSNQFDNLYRASYTYNLSGNLTGETYQYWMGSQWENDYRTVISYNSNNLIDVVMGYSWNGSQWVIDDRSTVTSNLNNKITEILSENWNGLEWELSVRNTFVYNGNNQIINETDETWDGSSWTEDYVINYTIDGNGNAISGIGFESGSSYDSSKTEYSYDTSALISNFAHPFKDKTGIDYLFEHNFVNKILSETVLVYDNSTTSYVNNNRTTYNYTSAITLSTKNVEISKNNVRVFPNPANNFIQVSGLLEAEPYEVYNTLGAKVSKGIVANNQKMDIQNLTNGLYFLKFKNGSNIKFIREQ